MTALPWDMVRAQVEKIANAKPHRKRLAAFRDITAGDTEDLFQDVAVALLSMPEPVSERTQGLSSRVSLITYRRLQSLWLRAITIRRRRTEIELHLVRIDDSDSSPHQIDREYVSAIVDQALRTLSPLQEAVMRCRWQRWLTLNETAVEVKRKRVTVKNTEIRVLYALRHKPGALLDAFKVYIEDSR